MKELELEHVVITSVDRDDLSDGGAKHFVDVINCIRNECLNTTIEILTPDFLRKKEAINILSQSLPDVFNHNLETVPRLYSSIRPGSRYNVSLELLRGIKRSNSKIFTAVCVQVNAGNDIDSNIESAVQGIAEAACGGAEFVALPENVAMMPGSRAEAKQHAADVADHPAVQAFQSAARTAGVWVLAGTVGVPAADDRVANRSLLIAPDGTVNAQYDKIHMFDADPGDAAAAVEAAVSATYSSGLRTPDLAGSSRAPIAGTRAFGAAVVSHLKL